MRRPKGRQPASARHPQSAVGVAGAQGTGDKKQAAVERNSGTFRFWHDERRFKGGADKCLVQQALFAAGGVRTGGYPKAAPISGPLGCQRLSDWDMLWSPARSALRAVPFLKPGQLVSAVPGMYSLTKKRRLSSTLSAAYGEHAWQLVPQSYSLPAELQQWRAWLDEQAAAGSDPGPWMLKTAQHLGKGLVLLPGEAAYTAAQQPRLPSAKPFVLAQRYVANPLLINGAKFGIRLWLLVTGVDPFTTYLHREGLVLFSTDSYDMDSLSDDEGAAARGHITNYAQNVNGTVWNLDMLKQHLGAGPYKQLWSQLVSSAAHVACAALGDVRTEHRKSAVPPNATFELLGLDYLVDGAMHPWLLEVNGTPSLAVEHGDAPVEQLIHSTKNAMVKDMVGILNCQQRFLARYGQQQPGQKLPPQTARRLQTSLGKDDEALQRKRVEAELKHRGGFLPLMAHYPVAKYGAASSSSSSSSSLTAAGMQQSGPVAAAADDAVQQPGAAEGEAAAAAVAANGSCGSSSGGVPFSERDKRTCLFVQQYLQQHRKLAAAKRQKQQRQQAGGAEQAGDQDSQAQQQGRDAMPMEL